jgi:hypothetical protein
LLQRLIRWSENSLFKKQLQKSKCRGKWYDKTG